MKKEHNVLHAMVINASLVLLHPNVQHVVEKVLQITDKDLW